MWGQAHFHLTGTALYSPQGLGTDERSLEAQEPVGAPFLAAPSVHAELGAPPVPLITAVFLVPLTLPLVPPVTDEERHTQSDERDQGGQDGRQDDVATLHNELQHRRNVCRYYGFWSLMTLQEMHTLYRVE